MITSDNYIDLADGRFHGTTPDQLRQLFAQLEASEHRDHLVVHFHGGLVSRTAAERAAEGLMPAYEAGGAYPAFFFWRSDLWTTLRRNLDEIAQEHLFNLLVRRLVRLAGSALGAQIGARAGGFVQLTSLNNVPSAPDALQAYAKSREPDTDDALVVGELFYQQALDELKNDPELTKESVAIAMGVVPRATHDNVRAAGVEVAPKVSLLRTEVLDELQQEQQALVDARSLMSVLTIARTAVKVLRAVLRRYARRRDHGLYPTIVEEVLRTLYIADAGAVVWGMMKKDTADAFAPNALHHGGTAFVAHLKDWWRPGRRITLVGHSAGAVYVGHFLRALDAALPVEARVRIALLAPACTFKFFASHRNFFAARVERIQMFALKDEIERGYWEVPVIYPASLLYMVSGLFEPDEVDMPLVGMQRYYTGAAPYDSPDLVRTKADLQPHTVWSQTNGQPAGGNSTAQKHGAFDEDGPTLASLTAFLQAP